MSNQISISQPFQQNQGLDPVIRREVETLVTTIFKKLQEKSKQKGYELTKSERLADRIATFADKILMSIEKPTDDNVQNVQGLSADLIKYLIESNVSDKRKEAIHSILGIANSIIKNKSSASELSLVLPFVKALLVITSENDSSEKLTKKTSEKRTFELDPKYHNTYSILEARYEVLSTTLHLITKLATEPSFENEEEAKLAIQGLYRLFQENEQQSMAIIGGLLSSGKEYFWNTAPWEIEELRNNTLSYLQKLCPGWEAGKYELIPISAPEEWSDEEYDALKTYVELEDLVLTYQKNPTDKNKWIIDDSLECLDTIFVEDDLQPSEDSTGRKIIRELMALEGQEFHTKWNEVSSQLQEICTPSEFEEAKTTSQIQLKELKDIKKLADILEKAAQNKALSTTCQERMMEMLCIIGNDNSNEEIITLIKGIVNAKEIDFWNTCKTNLQTLEKHEKELRIPNVSVALPKKKKVPATKEAPKNELGQDRVKYLKAGLKLIEKILTLSLNDPNAFDSYVGELVELYSQNDEEDLLQYLLTATETDSKFGEHIHIHLKKLQEMTEKLLSNKPSPTSQIRSTQPSQIISEEKEPKKRKTSSDDEDDWDEISF